MTARLSLIICLLTGFLTVSLPTFTSKASASGDCVTWAEYASNLPSQGGRGGQWKAFGSLPPEFENGCVLLQNNNSVDIAYVLKSGINPAPYQQRSRLNPSQTIPDFSYEQEENLQRLVNQGNALKVTWLTPTNGSLPYLRSIPKNRAFLRDDGMTCFSTICMESGALSHQELSEILSVR
ncbi:hypothetical protein [Roseofilum capinflatum]|uniref:Uncharacterized protein n=1 Tax=Roseofilum capinflatum BLCC-M114 TaxID=3022440 RepID=A0ABT7B6C6_9CYAN|nr:hypothetical protein [Roseofilum capinflatum]MDJ1174665.1 hypothetical protein [Roseofilum capinflatum BLCC-M114]